MDSREAREILALYRPGSTDAADPRMAEALEQTKRDPELAAWFREHCEVYTIIRGRLKEIPIPAGLKRQIIVEQPGHATVIRLPAAVKILLAAAAIVMLTVVTWFHFNAPPSETSFASYRDRMARSVQRGNTAYMKKVATNQADIVEYFRANNQPVELTLSKTLRQLTGEGGSVLTWNNHPVEMLCLIGTPDAAGQSDDLWVFILGKNSVADGPGASPQYARVGKLMTASWSAGGNIYVLAARGDAADLKKYLE